MGVFHHEEPPNPPKGCKSFTETIKGVFSNCSNFRGQLSISSPDEEYLKSEIEDEQEEIVSEIRSRAMEKLKHKPLLITDSFSWVFSLKTGELIVTPKEKQNKGVGDDNDREEFFSVGSCLSCCSSALSREAFFSVKTNFSCRSSFDGIEFPDFWKRSIIFLELCHCEGWPFGLCRKAVLLPPLPKSPSESWTWKKGYKTINTNRVSCTSPPSFSHGK